MGINTDWCDLCECLDPNHEVSSSTTFESSTTTSIEMSTTSSGMEIMHKHRSPMIKDS